jgi:uncharacterized protein
VYLGVRAIVKAGRGFRLARDGAPGALEYAVEMQSFRVQDTFAGLIAASALTRAHVAGVARVLADFHRSAEVVAEWGPDRVLAAWRKNVDELRAASPPPAWRLDVAAGFGEAFVKAHTPELRERAQLGLARDGHGDLRCEHILARASIGIVDRIEFDPQLRRTDIACDLAFLAMDLETNGQRWAAHELIETYRQSGMNPGGKPLRSFYAAHCALVRAKVALIAAAEHQGETRAEQLRVAQRLWSLSERLCWRARAPLAIVICGPAASGKSVLAAELARRSEMPVVCTDAVRKRLAHIAPTEPARTEHYSARFTRATYQQLTREALQALHHSDSVIVDATCRSRNDRAPLFSQLRGSAMTLQVVRCEVPLELALQRAAQRLRDPERVSDATPQIAAEQFRAFEELDELPHRSLLRLNTAQTLDTQVAELARAVDRGRLEGEADPPTQIGDGR